MGKSSKKAKAAFADAKSESNTFTENVLDGNASPENASPENAFNENASPENASSENAFNENASPEDASHENASSENASPENAFTENALPDNAPPDNALPEKASSESAFNENVSPENANKNVSSERKTVEGIIVPPPVEQTPDVSHAAPTPVASTASKKSAPKADDKPKILSEVASVTAVTERETNKVMDKLDMISQALEQQQKIVTTMMGDESAQAPAIQEAMKLIMEAASDIQNKIYEAMDLMQFQDITRQKLERIILHLRQIHDYIVELLGTGFKSEEPKNLPVSVSRTIAQTGTTPDEQKEHADSVVEEFRQTSHQ